MRISVLVLCSTVTLGLPALAVVDAQAQALISLQDALVFSANRDPWIDRSNQVQAALEARSVAAGAMPDPVVTLGVVNLPTDTFSFNQEQMTQARVGISQRIPRGATRQLQRQKFTDLSSREPLERDRRRFHVAREVSLAWLEVYRAQRAVALIEGNRSLFDYLVDLTRSQYTAVLGKTQQQDVVRAELELTRLEDRLFQLHTSWEEALATLSGWLTDPRGNRTPALLRGVTDDKLSLELVAPSVATLDVSMLDSFLTTRLQQHPEVRSLDQRIEASRTDRELAEQAYKPGLSINASYGYRDDSPMDQSRADFFSLGVAIELPLYTSTRQDSQVQAAAADSEALRTERSLLLRELRSAVYRRLAKLKRLGQRAELYEGQLLLQLREQSEAYLSAYRADEAGFDNVVSARIDELNALIEAMNVDVDLAATTAELNYLLAVAQPAQERDL